MNWEFLFYLFIFFQIAVRKSKSAHLLQGKDCNVPACLSKTKRNIPPFPKATSEVGVNMWRDVKLKVGLWTVI